SKLETLNSKLSLRELEALSCSLLAVLLALFAARIAREHAFALELFAQLGVEHNERAGNAQLHRAGLSVDAAARDAGHNVEGGRRLARNQGLLGDAALRVGNKILIEGAAVHRELAATRAEKYPRDAGFAPSCAVVLNLFCHKSLLAIGR